jgi:hypothetical protein
VTALALKPCKAPSPNSAVQEAAELLLEKRRETAGISAGGGGEEGFQVLAHHLVEHGALRLAGRVAQGGDGRAVFVACGGLAQRSHEPRSWQPRATAASLRVDIADDGPRAIAVSVIAFKSVRTRTVAKLNLLYARWQLRGCEEIPGPSRVKSAEQRKEPPAGIPGRYSEELRRRDATAI